MWHLRNKRGELNAEERALKDEFNLKIVYPDELFYRTHKKSQKDLLTELREARDKGKEKKVRKIILALFDDDSIGGRRGIKPLKDSLALVKRKMTEKEKKRKFAQRLTGNQEGMSF